MAFVLAVVAMAAVVRLPSFVHQLFDPDEAAIASQAITMRDGGTLYVDAIDRKPPLPPMLYEASFRLTGSTDLRPLHLLAALGLAGAGVAVGLDTRRRHGPRAGWWAAALVVGGAVAFFPVDGQAANYAHLALLPGALAVVWARRGTTASALGAGAALGAAILCRQSWLIGIVPAVVACWVHGRRRDPLLLGAAATATVAAVGLAVPLGEFWRWTFTENGGYVLAGSDPAATLGRLAATVGTFAAFHLALVAGAAIAGRRQLGQWLARPPRGSASPDRWADLDLWLWVATGLVAVATGFRFFGHYWLQVLPAAALLAAPALAPLGERWRDLAIGSLALATAVALAFALVPGRFRTLPDPAPLAAYVDAHTDAGDYVMVWGNFPEVAWTSDRPPGGALVHSDFVTGRSGGREAGPATIDDATPGAQEALLRAVRRHPPALVIDTSPSGLREYDAYPLSDFPAIHRWLTDHYRPTAQVDGSTIYSPR